MANDFTPVQIYSIVNAINEEATGQRQIAPTNTAEFISVGTTLLKMGYDPILKAISTVLTKTIFDVRRYNAKFKGLIMDNQKWGATTRKLNIVSKDFEEDAHFDVADDGSWINQWAIRKPEVLQTNFYGSNIFSYHITQYKDQLDMAFRSESEFGQFLSMVATDIQNTFELAKENMARATLANMIAGVEAIGNTECHVHLLTEYNTLTGLSLTAQDVYKPANIAGFFEFAVKRIKDVSDLLTDYSVKYCQQIDGKPVRSHVPASAQKLIGYSKFWNTIDSMVSPNIYKDFSIGLNERTNYWQSIDAPMQVQATPSYLATDGTITTAQSAETIDNLVAVLYDEDALGITTVNEWSATTGLNANGGYINTYWHWTERYFNDFMKKFVMFTLD